MNKLRVILFLLLAACSYNHSIESFECKAQWKHSTSSYLAVSDIQDEGLRLVLNDGSEWDIKYFGGFWKFLGWGWTEQMEISHWTIDDTIEIQYPDSGNLTDFLLVVNNLTRKEKALASLKKAPSIDHAMCLWVVDFDKEANHLLLSDGTVWIKTITDMYGTFFEHKSSPQGIWEIGDALTLVRGEGWMNANSFFLWNHSINEMPWVKKLE